MTGLSQDEVDEIREQADDDCERCGGTGEVVKMVMGRSGMVPCPSCRPGAGI